MEHLKKDSLKEALQEARDQDVFGTYVRELRLSAGDLKKHILDVGADTGEFAAEAKRRGYTDITSIDIEHPADQYEIDTPEELAGGKLAVADALRLPFKDDQFDIVVSVSAIPNVRHRSAFNENTYKHTTQQMLLEMLRVGREVRLGNVFAKEVLPDAAFSRPQQIDKVLHDLRDLGVVVHEELNKGDSIVRYIRLEK